MKKKGAGSQKNARQGRLVYRSWGETKVEKIIKERAQNKLRRGKKKDREKTGMMFAKQMAMRRQTQRGGGGEKRVNRSSLELPVGSAGRRREGGEKRS